MKKNAIIYAAGEGHTEIVQYLLGKGIDVNAVYDNDLTILMWAAGFGRRKPSRRCSTPVRELDLRDNRGKTALEIARDNNHQDTAALIERAAPGKSTAGG